MISYTQAIDIIYETSTPAPIITVPVLEALGKTCAADISSPIHVPSFRNSAMDGFAVRLADIAQASQTCPVHLQALPPIAAGEMPQPSTIHGTQPIMTGARVPEIYDAVVPIEDVVIDGETITFTQPAKPNQHIRAIGEDATQGQSLLHPGQSITAERIMQLAGVGIAQVAIYDLPKLHIISTGNEVVDASQFPLPPGKIYNSSAPYVLARCADEGLIAHYEGIIADHPSEFEACIAAIPAGSVIISTGAVSKGQWDFIPDSLQKLGAKIHFHRVNIRPGKPILFATLPNGSYYFGLPGNPISTAVGLQFFVIPLLRALQGLPHAPHITATLAEPFTKRMTFRQFLKAEIQVNAAGHVEAYILDGQESFKINSLANANAWVMLDEDMMHCPAGTLVQCIPFARRGI